REGRPERDDGADWRSWRDPEERAWRLRARRRGHDLARRRLRLLLQELRDRDGLLHAVGTEPPVLAVRADAVPQRVRPADGRRVPPHAVQPVAVPAVGALW